jgi:hypothetical protein
MLLLGEIRTGLLRTSGPLPTNVVEQVLELTPGRRVLTMERPRARSVSAPLLTGIDCPLATSDQRRTVRGIGTVTTTGIITGGLVLQASASSEVVRAAGRDRLPWAHYAARPGVIETIQESTPEALAAGYLAAREPGTTLDLGAVAERLIGRVQRDRRLDHVTALRSRPTRVRWAAVADDTATVPSARVQLEDAVVRTITMTMPPDQLEHAATFCEDVALHDWLLTTLDRVIEEAERLRAADRDSIDLIRAAVERLEHLWMPNMRMAPQLASLWPALEREAGFSLQWSTLVGRIHSQIALQTLQALADARRHGAGW